jgi:hypothetical protein
MKHAKLLLAIIATFTLVVSACVPGPNQGQRGPRLSAKDLFTNADLNGDNMLTIDEFESSLPQ